MQLIDISTEVSINPNQMYIEEWLLDEFEEPMYDPQDVDEADDSLWLF